MAVEFPSVEELKTWEHELLDFIYIRSDEDRSYMQEIPADLRDAYELSAIGVLLIQEEIASHERTYRGLNVGFLRLTNAESATAQQTHSFWSQLGDNEREVYIQAAKDRPDHHLRDEIFYRDRREREIVRHTYAHDRSSFGHFILGARTDDPHYIRMLYLRTRSLHHF